MAGSAGVPSRRHIAHMRPLTAGIGPAEWRRTTLRRRRFRRAARGFPPVSPHRPPFPRVVDEFGYDPLRLAPTLRDAASRIAAGERAHPWDAERAGVVVRGGAALSDSTRLLAGARRRMPGRPWSTTTSWREWRGRPGGQVAGQNLCSWSLEKSVAPGVDIESWCGYGFSRSPERRRGLAETNCRPQHTKWQFAGRCACGVPKPGSL